MAFTVTIDQFEGPLDLMLHLIKDNKLELFELDMDVLTDQYLQYLNAMESMHLEIASEYLAELAGLIEYKSRKLLPREKVVIEEEYEEDQREKLVRRLLEYQRYKEVSEQFEQKYEERQLLMSKPMYKSSLISAFSKTLGEKEEYNRKDEESVNFDFTGRRVLLAEDNQINTEVAIALLESKGFIVVPAENGLRAMELFSKSSEGYYDAILMDIRMPIMDGLSAANTIRHLSNSDAKTIPIIAMTANAFDEDIEKSKAAGMNAHLAKPIEPERMYKTLYDLIMVKEEAHE